MRFNPTFACDAYKLDHRRQYGPLGSVTRVYSNLTPRASRIPGVKHVVFFGLQAFLQDYCEERFGEWFAMDEDQAVADYVAMTVRVLGPNDIGGEHIRALHRLGYLPLRFCALPEGTLTPLRVPMFTVENTLPEFFWLTNYIESILSTEVWLPCTSATTSWRMRRLLDAKAAATGGPAEFVDWQGHDFSFRGMTSEASAAASGAGHLLSFTGTDSIPALEFVDAFYPGDNGLVGGSVAATEHSVMSTGMQTRVVDGVEVVDEYATLVRLLDLYPTGILSVVSDTFDLWHLVTEVLPTLKDRIMARDGKLVIRPDSGDPVDIVCGTQVPESIGMSHRYPAYSRPFGTGTTPEEKGVAELLWDVFGGTVNAAGYRELDPHISIIYGDSITYDRANQMTDRLAEKGFTSTNLVLGIGSYTFQATTRDVYGFAVKATYVEVNGEGRNIYKDPVTDNGVKKSATGRLSVTLDSDGALVLTDRATPEQEAVSLLEPIWEDGKFVRRQSYADVRARLREQTAALDARIR